jgi:hypothetical protein
MRSHGGGKVSLIALWRRHALPLPAGRFWRPRTNRRKGARCPRNDGPSGRGNRQSATTNRPWHSRGRALSVSASNPQVDRFSPNRIQCMSAFDPSSVRQAVAEFTPRRPQRFQDLYAAKEVISELRQKRASYRAIAELLTQHCLPVCKTAVAEFRHEVLGEIARSRRRPGRKRPVSTASPILESAVTAAPAAAAEAETALPPTGDLEADQARSVRPRGPRIAQDRMVASPAHPRQALTRCATPHLRWSQQPLPSDYGRRQCQGAG